MDSNHRLSLPKRGLYQVELCPVGTARRDRTCLVLRVMQVRSLDHQRRAAWITCESNAVQAPYQRAQGDQPVVIRGRAGRESNPPAWTCKPRSSSENRLVARAAGGLHDGANRGSRTLISGLEDRRLALGQMFAQGGIGESRTRIYRVQTGGSPLELRSRATRAASSRDSRIAMETT